MLYDPGIRTLKLEPLPDGSVKARLAIAPDCRLGPHAFRLRTASGISNLVTFSVGALPEIQEVEPNSDFEKPQKIALNTTVNGVIENEDVDYFLVEAKKGQRLTAEIEGIRLGQTFFDPYVAILDRDRFVLSGADDTSLVYQDAVASAILPKDGQYVDPGPREFLRRLAGMPLPPARGHVSAAAWALAGGRQAGPARRGPLAGRRGRRVDREADVAGGAAADVRPAGA